MKFNWGWGLAVLYCGFGLMIGTLVYMSGRQRCDLVSNDYYGEEIAFQKVLDGGKNQSALSSPIAVHASSTAITIDFPGEFKDKPIDGDVLLYCAGNADWDHTYKIKPDGLSMQIDRKDLHKTKYTVKIKCAVDGKNYYQESDLPL